MPLRASTSRRFLALAALAAATGAADAQTVTTPLPDRPAHCNWLDQLSPVQREAHLNRYRGAPRAVVDAWDTMPQHIIDAADAEFFKANPGWTRPSPPQQGTTEDPYAYLKRVSSYFHRMDDTMKEMHRQCAPNVS